MDLTTILDSFWNWVGMSKYEYASVKDPTATVQPFYFPGFLQMREMCKRLINTPMTPQEMDDFLTCFAIDEEEEGILDLCAELGDDCFLGELAVRGCRHLQKHTRWQIAELLRRRNIPKRQEYLGILCKDADPYVRKRAQNAMQEIISKGHLTGS